MAIALVQQVGIAGANTTSPHSFTLTATVNGNTLTFTHHWYSGSSAGPAYITGISDNASGGSNVWSFSNAVAQNPPAATSPAGYISGRSFTDSIAWCVNAKSVTSVTVTMSVASSQWWRCGVHEWSGIAQADSAWSGNSTTTGLTSYTTGPVAMNDAAGLIVGVCDLDAATNGTDTLPSGWTAFTSVGANIAGYRLPGAAGSQSPVFTASGFSGAYAWTGALATFSSVPLGGLLPQQERQRVPLLTPGRPRSYATYGR
jgi:hypothetical protein